MNVKELKDKFYLYYNEDSNYSYFSDSKLLSILNDAYMDCLQAVNWPTRWKTLTIKLPKTTVTTWTSATQITVDDASEFIQGQLVVIKSGNNIDNCKISSIDYTADTITLESPGQIENTSGTPTVSAVSFFIPHTHQIRFINYEYTNTSIYNGYLTHIAERVFKRDAEKINTLGTVDKYTYIGYNDDVLYDGTLITGSGSSIDVNNLGQPDNYYLGCYITDEATIAGTGVVESSTSGTCTLKQNDFTFNDEDSVKIYRNHWEVKVYPAPKYTTTLTIKYYDTAPLRLNNDYDVPKIPAEYHNAVFYQTLMYANQIDGNFEKMKLYGQMYGQKIRHAIINYMNTSDVITDDRIALEGEEF